MSTAVSVLGGIGLFLLGMTIMTDGLKGLAGSSLRTVLGKAAATPVSGALWGALVTLLVQSSSATTMTTIGLVSAGLLTFPQGLSLVFGANVGTTGTGWLVALIGLRVSLSAYALPMIFVGALARLMGKGRLAAAGGSLAGFALVLYGLTTLQQGMGGVAAALHPSDLPAVLGMPGVSWLSGWFGLLILVVAGAVMTTVMQSSTAAITVTLSAFYAGAIGLEQGCALIIGQNIGTATSSAMAAIGASATAKRLALAYILFKVIAALIAVLSFPFAMPLIRRAAEHMDGVSLLAAYHTAFNVVGVAILMPAIKPFTRFVERLLPEIRSALTRALDPAALENPVVAVEAVRRTIALTIQTIGPSIEAAVAGTGAAASVLSLAEPAKALREAQDFIAEIGGTPDSAIENLRLAGALHALDHMSRLVDSAGEEPEFPMAREDEDERRAAALCVEAMRSAVAAVEDIAREKAFGAAAAPIESLETPAAGAALDRLEENARLLKQLKRAHRGPTLRKVGVGEINVERALGRIETIRRLEALARHAWRAVAHLLGEAEAPK